MHNLRCFLKKISHTFIMELMKHDQPNISISRQYTYVFLNSREVLQTAILSHLLYIFIM